MQEKKLQLTFSKYLWKSAQILSLVFAIGLFTALPGSSRAGNQGQITAQAMTVTGVVTDENSKPMAGVNVTVKNSKKGVLTDADGKFTLEAGEGATLIISSAGRALIGKKSLRSTPKDSMTSTP